MKRPRIVQLFGGFSSGSTTLDREVVWCPKDHGASLGQGRDEMHVQKTTLAR
jgi:RecA/RadA recombinase